MFCVRCIPLFLVSHSLVQQCPFHSLISACFSYFCVFLLVVKSSSQHSTEVMSIGCMHQKAVMCLKEEIHVLLVELQSVDSEISVHEINNMVHLAKGTRNSLVCTGCNSKC